MDSEDEPIRITKNIYPYLAKKYETSTLNIEHNIRTVINVCWKMNRKEMVEIAGYPLVYKPTNSEFIDMVACYLVSAEKR